MLTAKFSQKLRPGFREKRKNVKSQHRIEAFESDAHPIYGRFGIPISLLVGRLQTAFAHRGKTTHPFLCAQHIFDAAHQVVGLQHNQSLRIHIFQALRDVEDQIGHLLLEQLFLKV